MRMRGHDDKVQETSHAVQERESLPSSEQHIPEQYTKQYASEQYTPEPSSSRYSPARMSHSYRVLDPQRGRDSSPPPPPSLAPPPPRRPEVRLERVPTGIFREYVRLAETDPPVRRFEPVSPQDDRASMASASAAIETAPVRPQPLSAPWSVNQPAQPARFTNLISEPRPTIKLQRPDSPEIRSTRPVRPYSTFSFSNRDADFTRDIMRPPKYGGHSKRDQLGSIAESWGPDPSDAHRVGLFQADVEPPSPSHSPTGR